MRAEYAAYLETPEGRLRAGPGFLRTCRNFCPHRRESTRCAPHRSRDAEQELPPVRLARLGIHVTLLDSSATIAWLLAETDDRRSRESVTRSTVKRG